MKLFILWFALALLTMLAFFIDLASKGKNNKKNLAKKKEVRQLCKKEEPDEELQRFQEYVRNYPKNTPKVREVVVEKPVYIPQPVREVEKIREVIIERPIIIVQQFPRNQFLKALPAGKRFVSVVFKGSGKHYDYLFNEDYDIQVGDYVEVCVHDKNDKDKIKKKIAKVRYISFPGEVSQYARSEIVRKATYNEWKIAS